MATDPWGVDDGYADIEGRWHQTPPETAAALRAAMGAEPGQEGPPASRPVWVVRQGAEDALHGPCELALEDGTTVRAAGALPPDLPIGYHDLHPDDGGPATRLIVTPGRCHLPPGLRAWLPTVQLPSCRSAASWGIGDTADLARIGRWGRDHGAAMVAVNPLHAPLPLDHVEPSPYYPSSRRWRNPLYLRIEEIPGAGESAAVAEWAVEARRLNGERTVDRDRVWALKRLALEHLWAGAGWPGDEGFARWRAAQGRDIEDYARFCALAERHGTGWSRWPAEHRHPACPSVAAFAAEHADRVGFWAWLQYLLDGQVRRAGEALPLLTDLAVGVDPEGADAWILQDVLALGVRVGAPPDDFNRDGQDWGLPPLVPWKLREAAYEPAAALWRSALLGSGGLRIDHVMGLFRLFWVPPGGTPAEGAYVRYRGDELLAVLAVESARAGAVVVGEDLGTVEPEVREALTAAGVLSYRLVWFEPTPPEGYPSQAMAAVTTHDLPTLAGAWTGHDDEDQRAAGVEPHTAQMDELRRRLTELSGRPPGSPVEEVIVDVYTRLAASPSALVTATLEDALAVRERPNLPGTTVERPNWSHGLPVPLEQALASPLLGRVASVLRR